MLTEYICNRLKEKYYSYKHPSGLRVLICPKEGFSSSQAMFGASYGSVDTQVGGTEIPAGVAHFLEHKLFEGEDGDAFSLFAETGADVNAFTSFDKTCYYFTATDNFEASFRLLLDFVRHPYFTAENVEKEKGIIDQEIRMYEDTADWRVFFNLLRALYHRHPVRIDIAGTSESIAEITPELLYSCYQTFYNLNNMVLVVTGNVQPEEILSLVNELIPAKTGETAAALNKVYPIEPETVFEKYIEQKLPVSKPLFNLGFKEPVTEGFRTDEEIASMEILLEILASESSPLYTRLMDKQLINDTFSHSYMHGCGYGAVIFGGESNDPDAVAQEICAEIARLQKEGIRSEDFERAKKKIYGANAVIFNSVSAITHLLADAYFSGREIYRGIEAIASAKTSDITRRLKRGINPANYSLSVIR